jgi:hypothetical protein
MVFCKPGAAMPSSRRDRDILQHIEKRLREDDPDFVVRFDLIERTDCCPPLPAADTRGGRRRSLARDPAPTWGWFDSLIWRPRSFVVAALVSLLAAGVLCVLLDRAARADDLLAEVL